MTTPIAATRPAPRPCSSRARRAAATLLAAVGALVAAAPASANAQESAAPPIDRERQDDLGTAHSVLQKAGLVSLGLTGTSGVTLMINKPTLFGEGRCKGGEPLFGQFGCRGLTYVHLGFGITTLGLFVAQEVVAAQMPISPYDMGSEGRQDAMGGLRVANITLFAVQPVLGLIATHPGLIGVPDESKEDVSRVLRTIHFGVGAGLATTYTTNAILQW